MPERYFEDVEKQCSPVTRSQYASNWYQEEEVIVANPGELATFTVSEDATLTVNELAELEANSENPNNRPTEVSRVLEEIPIDKQFSFTTHVKNSGQNPIFIQVLQMGENNQWQTLASTTVHVEADIDLMSLSKHNTNPLKVVFSTTGIARFSVGDIHLHRRDLLVSTITDYLCSVDDDFGGDYRFGFNGMHKDNEVKGIGNSLDFGARIYDSRLGRWLSLDKEGFKTPHSSPYNFGLNNPLFFIDPDGNTEYWFNGEWIGTDENPNDLVAVVTDANLANQIKSEMLKGNSYTLEGTIKSGTVNDAYIVVHKDLIIESNKTLSDALNEGQKAEFTKILKEKISSGYEVIYSKKGQEAKIGDKYAVGGDGSGAKIPMGDVSIHSHPTGVFPNGASSDASKPTIAAGGRIATISSFRTMT